MNSTNHIGSLLGRTAAFAQLSAETCERIAQLTSERNLATGEYLAREGDAGDELFIVVSGALLLTQTSATSGETLQLGAVMAEQVVGELSLLTGHPCAASMQAAEATVVRSLSAADFDQLCAELPEEMAATVAWMTSRLDAYQITAAIEDSPLLSALSAEAKREMADNFVRVDIRAGQTLFSEGDAGDALYLILSGRMRVLSEATSEDPAAKSAAEGGGRQPSDLGKGDILGELALLTGEPRSAPAIAVRDSHLARLAKPAFDRIVAAYPSELLSLFSRQLAGRLRQQSAGRKSEGRVPVAIAVLPLTAPVQSGQSGGARDFAAELVRQLSDFGPTLHLNRAVIDRAFRQHRVGKFGADSGRLNEVAERRLLAWLDDLEMLYRHVVYEADYQSGALESAWTQRCLRQADVLLVVAGGPGDPRNSEQTMVRLTQKALPSVKTTLVLLHDTGPGTIAQTRMWKRVMGIAAHEHVRRLETGHAGQGQKGRGQIHAGDVGRIARALNRQSVGLVLGGGFALGLAHIGVVDAMRELDIPIDHVGGTSMGAIIAAACAQEFTHEQMIEVMEVGCARSLKGDYTLPLLSLLTGKKVNRELGKYLEHLDMEDLWLPCFAISASLVHARMVVHTSGSALRSVVASCRAPGMFPPLGWDGDLLVDGGLVNNIPADVMRQALGGEGGSGTVFAADVSPETEFTAGDEFGMQVSGWQVARRNFSPFRSRKKMGTLGDVLMRLIRLGGVAHKQQIRESADLYMTVPLERFSIRDFHRGAEISKVGYEHAKKELEAWIAKNGRPWTGSAG